MNIENQPRNDRRRLFRKSPSEEPSNTFLALKRTKLTIESTIEFLPLGLSTPYLQRPFEYQSPTFSIGTKTEFSFENSMRIWSPISLDVFQTKYPLFLETCNLILGKLKEIKPKKPQKLSLKDEKLSYLETQFKIGNQDFAALEQETNLPRQKIRYYWQKYNKQKDLLHEYRGNEIKIKFEYSTFIESYFNNPNNFSKTVLDLYTDLLDQFKLEKTDLTYWSLYKHLTKLRITYKTILYKTFNANTNAVKQKRFDLALNLFGAHLEGYDFIYIDETSFNFDLWPKYGWAPRGKHPKSHKPGKSKNYSTITAMDTKGILGVKIVKGGVKGADFFMFITNMIACNKSRFDTKKVILFLDNASIHKTKDLMQKLTGFFNVVYNAPYTPQFNPIEFAFSKMKKLFREKKPKTEIMLIRSILLACQKITDHDCAEYILHSLKFLEKAINREDFF